MKRIACLAAILVALSSVAGATEPTTASIEKLLEVSQAQKNLESMTQNIDRAMRAALTQSINTNPKLNDEARQRALGNMDRHVQRLVAVYKEELNWKKLKELYVQVYAKNLDQSEVDGLTQFYQSSTGKAFTTKMPLIMQQSAQIMQERAPALQQKVKAVAEQITKDIEAASAKAPAPVKAK